MNGDRVSIKLIDDVRPTAGSAGIKRGSELKVDSITAVALVLSGAAIQIPERLTP